MLRHAPRFYDHSRGANFCNAPLSGSIISQRVFDVLMQGADEFGTLAYGWTYSAHPVGAAAGIAALNLVDSLGLVENARDNAAYLLEALSDAVGYHRNAAEIRDVGLVVAVELHDNPSGGTEFPPMTVGPQISDAMTHLGVNVRPMLEGKLIGFAPPFCISREEIDIMASALRKATKEVLGS